MTATWTEAWSSFTPAGTGWQDYDIFTALGVPKGAVAHIFMVHGDYTNPRTMGVRTDGSALNRYIKVHRSVNDEGGVVGCAMWVKVHATTGLIETYADSTGSVTFYCTGYWTGVDFTELMASVTAGNTAAWVDWDVGALGVPDGSICSVACCNHQDAAQSELGVRTNGSALARYHTVHQALSSSTETTDCESFTISVVSNASDGLIEYYNNGGSVSKYHLLGYFGSGLYYTETVWQLATGSAADQVWTDVSMAAYVPANAIMDCMVANTRSFAYYVGARANGSSLQRKWVAHQPEDTYRSGECLPTAVDASSVYEMIDYDWAYPRNGPYGYYTTSPPPQVAVFSPSSNTANGTSWSNPAYAYSDNTQYATSSTNNASNIYGGYSITGEGDIQKVEVNGFSFVSNSSSANKLRIAVSWDGGTSWGSNHDLSVTNTSTPTDKWVDVTADTTWDWTKLGNLQVKITYVQSGTSRTISLDWLPVRVSSVAAEEPTVKTFSVADALGLADAAVRSIRRMVVIDSLTTADADRRSWRSAIIADTLAEADSASLRGLLALLAVSDSMSAADVPRRSARRAAVADGAQSTDGLWKHRRSVVTDTTGFGDAPRRSWRRAVAADALAAADALWKRRYVAAALDAAGLDDDARRSRRLMALADSLAATDGARRALRHLVLADALSATEALQKIRRMAVADDVGAQDAQVRGRRMSLADGLVQSEALWKRRYVATLADAMVASDAAAVQRRYKFVIDSTSAADLAARVRQRKLIADTAAFTDLVARVRAGKFAADAASFADRAHIVARRLVAVDTAAMADYAELLGTGAAIYDHLYLADAAVRAWRSTLTVDAVHIVDAASRSRRRMAIADGLSLADAAHRAGRRMTAGDAVTAADAVWKHRYLAALDATSSTDAAYRPRRSSRAADALQASDSALRSRRRLGIGDLCAFTDVAQLMGAGMYAQDAFLASDAAVRALRRLGTADNATLADAALRSRRRTAASDLLTLTDAVRRSIRRMAASDIAGAADQAAVRAKHKAAQDYLGAVEAVWMRRTLQALDTLTAADATSMGSTLHVVSDALRVTDVALLRAAALVFELLAEAREAVDLMAALGEASLWGEVDIDRYLDGSIEEHELRARTDNEKEE